MDNRCAQRHNYDLPCISIHFSELRPFEAANNEREKLRRTHRTEGNDRLDWFDGKFDTICIFDIAIRL